MNAKEAALKQHADELRSIASESSDSATGWPCVNPAYLRRLADFLAATLPGSAQEECSGILHTAVCQAVSCMNTGGNAEASRILRKALVDWADAAPSQPSAEQVAAQPTGRTMVQCLQPVGCRWPNCACKQNVPIAAQPVAQPADEVSGLVERLREIEQTQPETIPVLNDEVLRAEFVFSRIKGAAAALESLAQSIAFKSEQVDRIVVEEAAATKKAKERAESAEARAAAAERVRDEAINGIRASFGARVNTYICIADSSGNEIWRGHVDNLRDKLRELAELRARLAACERDAGRYRWLREQDWDSSPLCVLRDPKKALTSGKGLGADCPSHSRLDEAIDALSAPKGEGN